MNTSTKVLEFHWDGIFFLWVPLHSKCTSCQISLLSHHTYSLFLDKYVGVKVEYVPHKEWHIGWNCFCAKLLLVGWNFQKIPCPRHLQRSSCVSQGLHKSQLPSPNSSQITCMQSPLSQGHSNALLSNHSGEEEVVKRWEVVFKNKKRGDGECFLFWFYFSSSNPIFRWRGWC